jgi:hypothetical protein
MKDWTGNKASTFICLGASNHTEHDRAEHDYYATDPKAAELLLEVEPELNNIWECACGEGHLAKVFDKYNKLAKATDLIDRGYGDPPLDFLKTYISYHGDIVTNPPYKFAKEFIEQALCMVEDGRKVCMFLKVTFLEGKARKEFFKQYPPKTIYVCSGRIKCALNGDFDATGQSAACYAWFVWEKGFEGKPTIEWIN